MKARTSRRVQDAIESEDNTPQPFRPLLSSLPTKSLSQAPLRRSADPSRSQSARLPSTPRFLATSRPYHVEDAAAATPLSSSSCWQSWGRRGPNRSVDVAYRGNLDQCTRSLIVESSQDEPNSPANSSRFHGIDRIPASSSPDVSACDSCPSSEGEAKSGGEVRENGRDKGDEEEAVRGEKREKDVGKRLLSLDTVGLDRYEHGREEALRPPLLRSRKRRRVSIGSGIRSGDKTDDRNQNLVHEMDCGSESSDTHKRNIPPLPPARQVQQRPHRRRQPIFTAPPRFRDDDDDDSDDDDNGDNDKDGNNVPLPPLASSPHSRRTRKRPGFVPGGLACVVQGWLSELAASASSGGHVARMIVDQVSPGPRAMLVVGRHYRENVEEGLDDGNTNTLHVVLVGGQVDKRNLIGSVIGWRGPTWDTEMDGRLWAVCCDWVVLSPIIRPASGLAHHPSPSSLATDALTR